MRCEWNYDGWISISSELQAKFESICVHPRRRGPGLWWVSRARLVWFVQCLDCATAHGCRQRATARAGPVSDIVWPCGSPVALGGPAHNPTVRPFNATPPHGGSLLFQKNRRLYHPRTQSHFQKQNRTRTCKGPMRRVAVSSHTPATRQVVSCRLPHALDSQLPRCGVNTIDILFASSRRMWLRAGKDGRANWQNGGWELAALVHPRAPHADDKPCHHAITKPSRSCQQANATGDLEGSHQPQPPPIFHVSSIL